MARAGIDKSRVSKAGTNPLGRWAFFKKPDFYSALAPADLHGFVAHLAAI